jgi:pimeloyl-ACP methyl ester carboxylesterase
VKLSDGRTLGFAEFGDPRGKPLLYFHGGMSCRLDIAFAAEQCAERGIRIISPDRPGTGLSDPLPNRNLLDWAIDVEEFLNELELDQVALMGWSLGSSYVFPCAYRTPDRFTRIATTGSCAMLDSPQYIEELGLFVDRLIITCPPSMRWALRSALVLLGKAPAHMLKNQAEKEVSASPADLAVVRAMSFAEFSSLFYGSLAQGGDGIIDDYWAAREPWGFSVSEIGIDMMLFHGDQDTIAPISGATRLSDLIPGARLIDVPGAGHFVQHTKLDLILDALFK